MKKEERLEIFKINLSKIVEGNEGSFVIFNVRSEKFVQFAGSKEMGLVCDIPLAELSKEEEKRLLSIKDFSEGEGARDAETKELTSYQIEFNKDDINKAVELTERIFIEVFRFPTTYNVDTELNLEK